MQILGLADSTPKPTSRARELFWPHIIDEVSAVTAARNAMYASFVVAVATVLLTGGVGWLDALLFLMIGVGIRQLSRVAAVTGLLLYVAGFVATVIVNPSAATGILGRFLGTAIFLGGVRAAFFANRNEDPQVAQRIANPEIDTTGMSSFSVFLERVPARTWPYLRIPFFVVLILLTGLSLYGLTVTALLHIRPAADAVHTSLPGPA